MANTLEGIERARAIAKLLETKTKLQIASGIAKAQLVKNILELRSKLGMLISEATTLAGRLKARPLDLEKTLSSKLYSEQIKHWLPDLDISVDSMERENAKGAAAAVEKIASDYPEIFQKKNVLKIFGTGKDLKKIRKKQQQLLDEELDRIVQEKNLLAAKESEFDEIFSEWIDVYRGVDVTNRRSAKRWAEGFFLDVKKEKEINQLLKAEQIPVAQLVAACKKAKIRNMARGEAADELKKEKPELFETNIPIFKGMEQRSGTYAMYVTRFGIVATQMFESNMTDRYSKDVSTSFHPVGTGGEAKHLAAQAIIMHEFGHAMDQLLELSINRAILDIWHQYGKQGIAEGLSRYATDSIDEMIAEAFCEYKISAAPRALARQIGNLIDQEYARAYGAKK